MGCSTYFRASDGKWVGVCAEFPGLEHVAGTRDAAGSGIRRKVKSAMRPLQIASKATPTLTKRRLTRVAFVIDKSGSMFHLTKASVDALNENIGSLKEQSFRTSIETSVSVLGFDTGVRTVLGPTPVQNVRSFSVDQFRASGGTALWDATADGIERLLSSHPGADVEVGYLLIVITDGEENSSHRTRSDSLRSKIASLQASDLWTITFLVPPGAKRSLVTRLGVPEGNVREWEGTQAGVQEYSAALGSSIGQYYTSRSLGKTSVQAFFQTDLSKVDPKEIRRNLVDVSSSAKVFTVEKEEGIREFVERKTGKPLLKGAAFYQLTKGEKKVQDYKQLLVMEKGKKAIYGGSDARQVLGIPDGTLQVVPGNHANFDLFVQSTSTNRKLVRGTKLIYVPSLGVPFTEGPSAPRAAARRTR